MPEKTYVVGTVAAIFFQNPSNFYKVLLININETNADYKEKEIVVTGSFGDIQEDETYRFIGEFIEHPRYGLQLQVETYSQEKPTSESGLVQYLSSSKFPGIGKKTAEKIVEVIGIDAVERIIEDPSLLKQIPTLSDKKQQMITETIRLNHGMDQVIIGLNQYGFGSHLAFAIYQTYKNQTLEIIQENPYQLVEDIEGIGFTKADRLAEALGIEAASPKRMRAAIMHQIFQHSIQTGDTYVPAELLLEQTTKLLETSRPVEIDVETLANVIIKIVEEGKIQQEETKLYENSLYFSEWGIASSINRLIQNSEKRHYRKETLDKIIRKIEKRNKIAYGETQVEAMKAAVQSPLFILTGGPGTGKTTVINGIVQLFAELHDLDLDPSKYTDETFPIMLAAPTGRAAKRMNETTGLPSGTIHRLLGLNGRDKNPSETTKELEGGLLIVDEMSMVDTWLANTLLKAIPNNMQVIFVGDKDQLPSVGPGQVLHDLLATPTVEKCELTEIYRQGDGSSIISLAHDIKNGYLPKSFMQNQKDRSFFGCDAYQIEPLISQIVQRAKAKNFTAQDIQVLAPMYRGVAGIDALNKMLQEIFNPNDGTKKEVKWNDIAYRIGDKVLQLVNSPEENVFNGDMGQIVGITYAKDSSDKVDELVIQFDANEVVYRRNDWHKITLSYCCSIHKAQGSEFKMVIMPMIKQYQRMLQRNLLYTGITRSKEMLILLGETTAYERCVHNESMIRRTTLKERLMTVDDVSPALNEKINQFEETDDEAAFESVTNSPIVHENVKKEPTKIKTTPKSSDLIAKVPIEVSELTLQVIEQELIDPLIGMTNISPYDFLIEI